MITKEQALKSCEALLEHYGCHPDLGVLFTFVNQCEDYDDIGDVGEENYDEDC